MARQSKPIDFISILVVEDHVPLRRNIAFLLKVIGFQVTAVADGVEALAEMQKRVPDLIIADTHLPRLNGYDLLGQIRADQRWSEIPFIFVSDDYSLEALEYGLNLGADDYVPKPFDIYDLLDAIKRTLLLHPSDGVFEAAG